MARLPNTMVFVRNEYTGETKAEKEFAKIVEETQGEAYSLKHHLELMEAAYPGYKIMVLYTYRHSGTCVEKFQRCQWDSSMNGMAAFKNEADLDKKIEKINERL